MLRISSWAVSVPVLASVALAQSGSSRYADRARLVPQLSGTLTSFAHDADIDGDTAVVSTPYRAVTAVSNKGSVHIFERVAGLWPAAPGTLEITSVGGGQGHYFGTSVAVHGDALVAGAPGADSGGLSNRGAAYVFVRPAAGWSAVTQTARLLASDGAAGDQFGLQVAIDGDVVVVSSSRARAAYVYERPMSGWANMTEIAKLVPSDGAPGDQFGWSVAVSGDTIAVGARTHTAAGGSQQGAVYVYDRTPTGWASLEDRKLLASDAAAGDFLGASVAVHGDVVVAGATSADLTPSGGEGAVYLFRRSPGGWLSSVETAKLTASDATPGVEFGHSVAVAIDRVVVGVPNVRVEGVNGAGAVYVFSRPGTGWASSTESDRVTSVDAGFRPQFGSNVALSGTSLVVTRPVPTALSRNAVYVYEPVDVIASSGCGAPAPRLTGTTRIGQSLALSMDSCAAGANHVFWVGTPSAAPLTLPASLSCTGASSCVAGCQPVLALFGREVEFAVGNTPSLVGVDLCAQGGCLEPAMCLIITDAVTWKVSQ